MMPPYSWAVPGRNPGTSSKVIRGILKRRLLEVWWEIGEEVLNGLMESMPQRVDALVEAEGWYTDF